MLLKILLLFLSLLLSVPSLAKERQLSLTQLEQRGGLWVLHLAVPYRVEHSVFTLENPKRLVIDILDPTLKPKRCRIKMAAIKRCRIGRLDGKRARFVLDLKKGVALESSTLVAGKRKSAKPYLEVVFAVGGKSNLPSKNLKTEFAQKIKPLAPKSRKAGKFIIVLDAGHGGRVDVGSSNAGVDEKDLTLKYARELRLALSKIKNVEVRMTRTKR